MGACRGLHSRHEAPGKIQDKERPYKKLMQALQMRGYDAMPMISTFGVGGSIYQQAHTDMQELGATTAKATLRAIHLLPPLIPLPLSSYRGAYWTDNNS